MQEFAISIQPLTSTTAIIKMAGVMGTSDFDSVESEFHQIVESSVKGVVLDLSGLDSVTSAGFGSILGLSRLLASRQGKLILTALRPKLSGDIEMLGIENSLNIVESLEQAKKAIAAL